MRKQKRQYDPVAASAIAALNSTQRAGRTVRTELNAPQPPGVETAFNQTRSVLQQVSSLAPLNVLGSGQAPQLPGMQGQGGPLPGLPAPNQVLPGQGGMGAGGLPTPDQLLPGMGGQGNQRRAPRRNDGQGAGQGGKGAGSTDEDQGAGGRSQSETR